MLKNIIPVFIWAKANGEATVVDRILVKIVLELLKSDIKITKEKINTQETIEVDSHLYELIKTTAQNIVGSLYKG